jgi:excisionase family DNA binding protein
MEETMELITIKEAANQLKVHPNTIRNFIDNGLLKSFKIGRTVRIQQIELDKIVRGEK